MATTNAAKPTIVEAATVVCVRQAPRATAAAERERARTLLWSTYSLNPDATRQLGSFEWPFTSGFQVLMGQGEVVNWVRSSPENVSHMRYAGEMKFPGGSRDEGEALEETARRELEEEFMLLVPPAAILRPFTVAYTRVIQGKSFTMFNFAALAEENAWLAELDTAVLNGTSLLLPKSCRG